MATPDALEDEMLQLRLEEDGPWKWVLKVGRTHPWALLVALAIAREVEITGREPVTLNRRGLGLPAYRLDRALAALEEINIVRIDRHRGRVPRIWLIDKP